MNIETLFIERVNSLHARALRALVPLYERGKRGNPELIGSGLLIQARSSVILATAGHVSADQGSTRIYAGVGESLLEVPEVRYWTDASEEERSAGTDPDVSFWQLTAGYAESLSTHVPIRLDECDIQQVGPRSRTDDCNYLIVGYPRSRQPREVKVNNPLGVESFALVTRSIKDSNEGADLRDYIMLEFDKHDSYEISGRTTAPDLHGMSGGVVWYYPGLMVPRSGEPVVAGLVIAGRTAEPLGIRVTPIVDLLSGMVQFGHFGP